VLRYLLAHGYAHGIDAVSRAVRVCKETHVGAGWFLNQRITHMLGTALVLLCHKRRVPQDGQHGSRAVIQRA
jgi:hydrogenase/urease accessory protein HupE